MKKVLSFVGCALFVAAMTVACGHKNAEENAADEINNETSVEQEATSGATSSEEAAGETATMSDAEHAAMLDAAREAGRAKCNCYKTDAASVEDCINSLLKEGYAAYQNNEEFKSVMNEEFENCVKEKATEAVTEKANEATKAVAGAIADKLKK